MYICPFIHLICLIFSLFIICSLVLSSVHYFISFHSFICLFLSSFICSLFYWFVHLFFHVFWFILNSFFCLCVHHLFYYFLWFWCFTFSSICSLFYSFYLFILAFCDIESYVFLLLILSWL